MARLVKDPSISPESRRRNRRRKWLVALAVILIGGFVVWLWNTEIVFFPAKQTATVLVLEDCDDDFRTPPFEDAVVAFGPNGAYSRMVTNLNLCQTVGGARSLSVSPDGRFIVVCENMARRHLTAYETQSGKPLWNIEGEFTSATVGQNGTVYAIVSSGTIYGDGTIVIDHAGHITRSNSAAAGFDVALDKKREVLWLVGKHIKKCDLELNVLQELSPIKWCAVSVDVSPDGSIWVAEREHSDVALSTNRLIKISSSGQILKSVYLDWSPMCVRVDARDGSVWGTGFVVSKPASAPIVRAIEKRTGALPLGKSLRGFLTETRVSYKTHKFDSEGTLLHKINAGGHSLDIQSSDGSIWVAGRGKIYRFSATGKKLDRHGGVSADQKYVVVVPERGASAE